MNKKNFYDFSGGYNDTVHNLNLRDNEYSEFYNVEPMVNGGFRVRNGTRQMNQVAFPGEIMQIIEWKLRSGVTKTIVVSDRKLYEYSSVLDEWKPVVYNGAVLQLERDTIAYAFIGNLFYFTDGERMYSWKDNIYYLSNLDEYEHRFNQGDIIKLTVSTQESLFRNRAGVLMDVRNQMRHKFSYVHYNEFYDRMNHYRLTDVNRIKYKFVDNPTEGEEAVRKIYALKYSQEKVNNNQWDESDGMFSDMTGQSYPWHGNFEFGDGENINDGRESYVYWHDRDTTPGAGNWFEHRDMYAKSYFEQVGNVGEYYQFTADVADFYPHNFNYITKEKYFGNSAVKFENQIVQIEESKIGQQITEVTDIPTKILSCSYFCFYGKRQRFFAGGNPNDPTAVYVSKLGSFTEWDEEVTIYPESNLGSVTGILSMGDDILVAYENGFCYVDSELSVINGSEAVVEYIPRMSSVPGGVAAGKSLCEVPQGIIFYYGENIYLASYSLFGKNYVKMPSQNEFVCLSKNKCEKVLQGSTNHKGIYHNHRYYLSFSDIDGKDKILIYDFSEEYFLLYGDVPVNSFISKEKGNQLIIAAGKYLISAFEEGAYSDFINGAEIPIQFSVKSKFFDIGYDYRRLQLNRMYLVMNPYQKNISDKIEETSLLQVRLRGDLRSQEIGDNLKDGILWENSTWGDRYAWNDDFVIHTFNLNFLSNRIGFSIGNSENMRLDGPLIFFMITLDYDKLSEDQTKLQDEPMLKSFPDFQHWPDDRI
ncbi:MAG: hypothetical protein J6K51_01800 [Clostridia bacterium]|nr:hypothetical protein [Clostridia bacterium]